MEKPKKLQELTRRFMLEYVKQDEEKAEWFKNLVNNNYCEDDDGNVHYDEWKVKREFALKFMPEIIQSKKDKPKNLTTFFNEVNNL